MVFTPNIRSSFRFPLNEVGEDIIQLLFIVQNVLRPIFHNQNSMHPGDNHFITASLHNVQRSAEAPLDPFGPLWEPLGPVQLKHGQRKQADES